MILCWDQDRFGRFDILEAGKWIAPFRDSGVRLETVAQGEIDWDDLSGQLIYSVNQLAKHQYLRDLSRNVIRGQVAAQKANRTIFGTPPYGYKKEKETDSNGKVVRSYLLPQPENTKLVKLIYREYLKAGGKPQSNCGTLEPSQASAGEWKVMAPAECAECPNESEVLRSQCLGSELERTSTIRIRVARSSRRRREPESKQVRVHPRRCTRSTY